MTPVETRKLLMGKYHSLYNILNPRNPFECFYCGLPATCRDHFPPLSRVERYRKLGLIHELYLLVPSCTECNSLLGDSLQNDMIERIEYLKQLLRHKYQTEGINKIWTEKELDEADLQGRLRTYVRGLSAKEKEAVDRVEWVYGYRAYLDYIEERYPELS